MKPKVLFTIGHSTREIEEFMDLLKAQSICQLVDVRTIPRSRKFPWFGKDQLAPTVRKAGIKYMHLAELGGLRRAKKDSANMGWRNGSFRGYADYMDTREFLHGLKMLNEIAADKTTAIMCSEAVPWRCHRSLIADAEKSRGIQVLHIMSRTAANEHKYTPFIKVERSGSHIKITYPPEKTTAATPLFP